MVCQINEHVKIKLNVWSVIGILFIGMKMIISDFRKSFLSFFRFSGLKKMVAVIEKTKTIMVKIIENKSENDFTFFRSFLKIAVFTR
jgi:hypothetical protein